MCTYQTETLEVSGSANGAEGWFPVSRATVYFDHPVHSKAEHTLNVDLLNPSRGGSAWVAIELDPNAAHALAVAILATLDSTPAELVGVA